MNLNQLDIIVSNVTLKSVLALESILDKKGGLCW